MTLARKAQQPQKPRTSRKPRQLGLLVGGAAVALVLCAGCQESASPTPHTAAETTVTSGASDSQLGSELDDLQSTLDNLQSQVNADSAP